MPGKNIIVRMADRLRAGKLDETLGAEKRAASESFSSRQHILARLGARFAERIGAVGRFAKIRCVVKPQDDRPERIMLVHGARVVNIRIAADTDHFRVAGSGIGKRFSANPAHLQGDDVVLLVADENGSMPFGSEISAGDFLEDLLR
jgi:hypothetical protein